MGHRFMPDSLIERQGAALRDLVRLAAERAKGETSSKSGFGGATAAAEKEFQAARQAATRRFEGESAEEERSYQTAHQAILDRFNADHAANEKQHQTARR